MTTIKQVSLELRRLGLTVSATSVRITIAGSPFVTVTRRHDEDGELVFVADIGNMAEAVYPATAPADEVAEWVSGIVGAAPALDLKKALLD